MYRRENIQIQNLSLLTKVFCKIEIIEPLAPIPRRQLLTTRKAKWKKRRKEIIRVSKISNVNMEKEIKQTVTNA